MLTGSLGLADLSVKNAQLLMHRPEIGDGGRRAEGNGLAVLLLGGLGVLQDRGDRLAALRAARKRA